MITTSALFGVLLFIHNPVPTVHFFYVQDCGHCMDILLGDIPRLQDKYRFQFRKYDIDITDNYRLLEKMEGNVKNIGEDLPVIFIADSVFYGPLETREKLEPTLKIYAKNTGHVIIKDTTEIPPDTISTDTLARVVGSIHLYYFYQPGCEGCDRTEIILRHGQQVHYQLVIHRYDILDDSNKVFFEALAQKIGLPDSDRLVAPTIIIGDNYLSRQEINLRNLDSLALKYQKGSPEFKALDFDLAEKNIIERFARFSIFGIIFAGLLDGVNPCAFATLIFFVGYLLFIGRRRRDIIIMSFFFILAVFISYFAIGLGAYNLLKYLSNYALISKLIFMCFGIIALVLGVLSLRDFLLARQGKLDKMILQLPLGIKQRIHKNIKEKTAVGGIIIGSLVAGLAISYLEFGCTGQVYLPTITFMISRAGIILRPLISLLLYNLMFILPLIIIAILASLFTTKRIAKSLQAKIPLIKLLTAMLFFALAILLILSA
jgi:cytochrome c biogenesis protein CcdA